MEKNNVWELVDLPPGHKTIGNKWVLKVKRKANGSIDKYKACLVAKGYTQREGIDYEDIFSPVVRFSIIRLILSIVAKHDLELFQMDVKTTFLNGELDEEIWLNQRVLKSWDMSAKCAISNVPSMVSNSHLGNGI
jgi:hypothetical protein